MMFDLIYADPPWEFKTWSDKGKGKSAERHYNTMTHIEIAKLGTLLKKVYKPHCALFMWCTCPILPTAIKIMSCWGFTYKTVAFAWVKTNKVSTDTLFWGMGYYTRSNVELCLLGTKGNPLKRRSRSVHQVIVSPVKNHSEKPDEAREAIEDLFESDVSRLELFGRKEVPGWTVLGDEITGRDIREDLCLLYQ